VAHPHATVRAATGEVCRRGGVTASGELKLLFDGLYSPGGLDEVDDPLQTPAPIRFPRRGPVIRIGGPKGWQGFKWSAAGPHKHKLKAQSRRSVPALHSSEPSKPRRFAYVVAHLRALHCLS